MMRDKGDSDSRKARAKQRSSQQQGDAFEIEVLDALRDIPNAHATPHVQVGGKDVDILLIIRMQLGDEVRVAVDAKDYNRPLTRDQAAAEVSSYTPLLQNGQVDQFMLVTRNGIGARAKLVFNGRTLIHRTLTEIQNLAVDPLQLVTAMERQFSTDKLDDYYVSPNAYPINIEKAAEKYDLWYNEFIAFAHSFGLTRLEDAKEIWS